MAEQKTVTVKLQVKELVFDVMNKTHLTGRSREAEGTDNFESAAHMKASEDSDNSYQIRHSIKSRYSELKVILGEYLSEGASEVNNLIDQEIDSDGVLMFNFNLPSNFNGAANEALASGMHDYIVGMVLHDWFKITNKKDADDYLKFAEDAIERSRRALYKRSRPQRPTYN